MTLAPLGTWLTFVVIAVLLKSRQVAGVSAFSQLDVNASLAFQCCLLHSRSCSQAVSLISAILWRPTSRTRRRVSPQQTSLAGIDKAHHSCSPELQPLKHRFWQPQRDRLRQRLQPRQNQALALAPVEELGRIVSGPRSAS